MFRTLGLIGALALSLVRPEASSVVNVEIGNAALPETCCTHCHKGKACGNACIARDSMCRQPPGCACDSWFDDELSF